MDNLPGRHGALDGIEEANEFAMPVLRHIAAEDGTVEHVKGGEQRRDAIALIIVRHGPAFARLERQTGLGPVERLDSLSAALCDVGWTSEFPSVETQHESQ